MIELLSVDIESVSSSQPRSNFSEADIDLIAAKILEAGGIIKPLILKKIGFERYEVINGHFEYYAVVKAFEKNPHASEVNALIISAESEEAVLRQAEALKISQTPKAGVEVGQAEASPLTDIKFQLETKAQFEDLASEIRQLKTELNQEKQRLQRMEDKQREAESEILKKNEPLEVFNSLSLVDLTFRLRSAGLTDKTAAKIAESVGRERKKEKFTSLTDVVVRVKLKSGKKEVKGISGDKMVAIIDSWSRLSFS